MLRTVTIFNPSLGNSQLAMLAQVLGHAPWRAERIAGCGMWQWRTEALVSVQDLKQIVPEADIVILEPSLPIKLACFDMDSTLIQAEVIDELAAEFGIKDKVAAITESAMRGEIDFRESFSQRLALLEGLSVDTLDRVFARLPIMPGAIELIKGLSARGIKTVILSGGFSFFAVRLAKHLGIDAVYSNLLDERDAKLTGRVIEPVVDADYKAKKLVELRDAMGLESAQVLAVGDGANDIPMLNSAGVGIAFHAKPKVQESAPFSLVQPDLSAILELI